jgi:hypothetical protein
MTKKEFTNAMQNYRAETGRFTAKRRWPLIFFAMAIFADVVFLRTHLTRHSTTFLALTASLTSIMLTYTFYMTATFQQFMKASGIACARCGKVPPYSLVNKIVRSGECTSCHRLFFD